MNIIAKGVGVTTGGIWGKARIINNESKNVNICRGDILVVESSDPKYSIFLFEASGVVIRRGARYSHISLIAIELNIPCVTQIGDVVIEEDSWIGIDADQGVVYGE